MVCHRSLARLRGAPCPGGGTVRGGKAVRRCGWWSLNSGGRCGGEVVGLSNSNFGFARGSGLSIDASRAQVANPSLTKKAEMTSPLSFDDLQSILHQRIDQLPDHRKEGPNTQYRIRDAALGAFGIFFTQSPSFLDYQRTLQQNKAHNEDSPQQATGYQKENRLLMRNHGFS